MKKIAANVFILFCFLLLSGCSEADTGQTAVRVGYFPNLTHAQALVIKNSGALENALGEDYRVSWTSFTAGSSEVEALFAGEIDLGYIGPVPAINANVKSNGDVTILANAADAGAVLIKAFDSAVLSVADLDGKTVAIPQIGNTQHLCLLNLLSEYNLAPVSEGGTVEVVAVDNANLQTMFDQGNIDAALVPEPWGTILTATSNIDLLLDYENIYLEGNYPVALIVVRTEFLEKHPDVVETFLQEHIAATDAVNNDSDASVDAIIKEIENVTGISYDRGTVLSAFSRTNITTLLNTEALKAFAQTSYEQGFISELPGDTLTDTSLLEKLLTKK